MNQRHLATNSRLLQNLNTYIDEDQISSSILILRADVHKLESATGPSLRTIKMHNEIAKLEDQLEYCKEQAEFRTKAFRESITNH